MTTKTPYLLTMRQTAQLLGVSEATVARRVKDGTLASVKLGDAPNAPVRIHAAKLVADIERAAQVPPPVDGPHPGDVEQPSLVHPVLNPSAEFDEQVAAYRASCAARDARKNDPERRAAQLRSREINEMVGAKVTAFMSSHDGVVPSDERVAAFREQAEAAHTILASAPKPAALPPLVSTNF